MGDLSALADIRASLDPKVRKPLALSAVEVQELTAFLIALTDPASGNLLGDIPARVPSGLSIFDR